MTTSLLSSDGTRIAYERTGDGPALIFVGAATQYRAIDQSGRRLAELLAPQFTVYRYDRRGRGESGDTAPYAVQREIDDLAAIVEAAGGSAALLGGSSGGVLALEAASTLPVTRVVMYEPPFIVDDSRPPVPDDYVEHLDELCAAGRRGDAMEYFMTAAVGLPAEMAAGMRSMPMFEAFEAVAHTIAYDGRFMRDHMRGNPESLRRFAGVQVPTLVLAGGGSPSWLKDAARALAEVLPNAEHRILPDQTHDVDVDVLAPVVDEFLSADPVAQRDVVVGG
jgi:pimeloyl-ACP methyl ester carboxylesterase